MSLIWTPSRRIIRPYDKPPFEWTQRFGLDKDHPLTANCVFYGIFNESSGNKVLDLSGNGDNGTITGATWIAEKFGPALLFNGSSAYVSMAGFPATAPLTMSIWYKPTTVPSLENETLFYVGDGRGGGSACDYFAIILDLNGFFRATAKNGSAGQSATFTTAAVAGRCYHVVAIFPDADTRLIYVDGVYRASDAGSEPASITTPTSVIIGAEDDRLGTSATIRYHADGVIDSPIIWLRGLSASEIALLYGEAFCMVKGWGRMPVYLTVPTGAPSSKPYYYREFASRRVA
jgi:hypothetical protein